MSDPGGPRFTGVIVARVGSSVEYVGNTSGIRLVARRDEVGSPPAPVPGERGERNSVKALRASPACFARLT